MEDILPHAYPILYMTSISPIEQDLVHLKVETS